MRWSTTLTWLALPYLNPNNRINLVNAQANTPSYGSKAQPGKPGQSNTGSEGGPPPPQLKDIATELLLLKPLNDGKVATHFEFEYLNRNGVPRNPSTLGAEDEGLSMYFIFTIGLLTVFSMVTHRKNRPALRILPIINGSNSP